VLPLGPTGAGDSPYQSFSAFAGNINLLSPELLQQDGLLTDTFWSGERFTEDHVDYVRVTAFKATLLRGAWDAFRSGNAAQLKSHFEHYCTEEAAWLDDYTLFTAIREALGGASLVAWPTELLCRNAGALAEMENTLAEEVRLHKFGQFLFDRQWGALKRFAAERNVKIIGDAPIFVSLDSSDVWANPEQFLLGEDRKPKVVAGVPPDYFSADGQHWGNPIYDWPRMEENGFAWWCARVARQLKQIDLLRLDHFRGFCQAWHIPASERTARTGEWVNGPGVKLFERLRSALGQSALAPQLCAELRVLYRHPR
jgi:4-alpha-glucanotransferase